MQREYNGQITNTFFKLDMGVQSAQNVILISQVKSQPTIYYCNLPFIAKTRGHYSSLFKAFCLGFEIEN